MMTRLERPGDVAEIAAITEAAFLTAEHRSGTEATIVSRLRDEAALSVSLVADEGGLLVGHVAFSPVTFSTGETDWYSLGPISVSPRHQRQGIGGNLVREGLAALAARKAAGCVLLGEPSYYSRFGFRGGTGLVSPGLPSEYLMALPLRGKVPSGILSFHSAFGVDTA